MLQSEAHKKSDKAHEILRTCDLLFDEGVGELRAFRDRKVVSGYFDDYRALAEHAEVLDGEGWAVYVVLNEFDPSLLARAANRINYCPCATTADGDITRRRWLLVDADPVRPSGVSATRAEKVAAFDISKELMKCLREEGWPEPLGADSGNGFHLLYPLDSPNDVATRELLKAVLEALAFRFDDERAKIDTAVYNAARIVRLYGTVNGKGDHTEERPHRFSKIIKVPNGSGGQRPVVDPGMLEAIARTKPDFSHENGGQRKSGFSGQQAFDLSGWIEEHEVPVRRASEWNRGGRRWVLEECPWNGHIDSSAYIVQLANGAVGAGCHHDSCQEYGWRELREHYEPGCYDRDQASVDLDAEDEAALEDLATELPPAPDFPLSALPPTLKRLVEEGAKAIGCPPAFIAVPMLPTLGAAIGNSRLLQLKRGWSEGTAIFAALVAEPGSKKTPAFKVATRPAWRRQAKLKQDYKNDLDSSTR